MKFIALGLGGRACGMRICDVGIRSWSGRSFGPVSAAAVARRGASGIRVGAGYWRWNGVRNVWFGGYGGLLHATFRRTGCEVDL